MVTLALTCTKSSYWDYVQLNLTSSGESKTFSFLFKCGKEPFDFSLLVLVFGKILIVYFAIKLAGWKTKNWKFQKHQRPVFLMTLLTITLIVFSMYYPVFQLPVIIIMLFNSVVGVMFLIDFKQKRKKLRWTINIGVSSLIVYFWWITNSYILLNIICFSLLFVLVRTIWLYSLQWAIWVLLIMILFDWIWKVVDSTCIWGPTLLSRIILSVKYYSMPIGFVVPYFGNRPDRCSMVSMGDIFYPCLFLAYLKRTNIIQPFYFTLTFCTFSLS